MSSIYGDQNPKPYSFADPLPNNSGSPADPYAPPQFQQPPPAKKSSWGCVGCLFGCLGVLIILALVGGFGVWYAFKKLPDFARAGIANAIEESDLSADDKRMVMQQVDRLVDGYKQGKVDFQKLGEFGQDFAESPLMDLLIAFGAKVRYIDDSGLSPEEKAEAEKILHRVARGVIEEKISQEDLDAALNHISNEIPNGGRQFKKEVSDTELRAFLQECKRLADEAMISNEELKVDIGGELKKLVDKTLGELPEDSPADNANADPQPGDVKSDDSKPDDKKSDDKKPE